MGRNSPGGYKLVTNFSTVIKQTEERPAEYDLSSIM